MAFKILPDFSQINVIFHKRQNSRSFEKSTKIHRRFTWFEISLIFDAFRSFSSNFDEIISLLLYSTVAAAHQHGPLYLGSWPSCSAPKTPPPHHLKSSCGQPQEYSKLVHFLSLPYYSSAKDRRAFFRAFYFRKGRPQTELCVYLR